MCGIFSLYVYKPYHPNKKGISLSTLTNTSPTSIPSTKDSDIRTTVARLLKSISHRGRDSVSIFRTTPRHHYQWTRYGKLDDTLLRTLGESIFPLQSASPPSPITNPHHPLHNVTLQHFMSQTRYVTSRAQGNNYDSTTYRKWNDPSDNSNPPVQLLSQIPPLHLNGFQIAHNGTVDKDQLLVELIKCNPRYKDPLNSRYLTDTQMIAGLLYYWSMPENLPNSNKQDLLYDAIKRFVSLFPTAYNLLVFQTTTQRLFAVRDPLGIRPLTMCIGRDNTPMVCFSSESSSFGHLSDTNTLLTTHELRPGEIIKVDFNPSTHKFETISTIIQLNPNIHTSSTLLPQSCVFEYVYLARPDSVFNNILINEARYRMGCCLAREESRPYHFDPATTAVACVPRTALPAAKGYADTLGLPYYDLLEPVPSVARTFLLSNPRERYRLACQKFRVCPPENSSLENITTWIFVDDSLVRGNTWYAVRELLDAGLPSQLTNYHLRLACPPIHYPDLMGIDIPTREELIANYCLSDTLTEKESQDSSPPFPFPHPPVSLQPPGTPANMESLATLCRVDTINYLTKGGVASTLSTLNPTLPASNWSMSWHDGKYPLKNF